MIVIQIRSKDGTGTLSYILADQKSKTAAIIDPNIEDIDIISFEAEKLGTKITHILDTHTHADHFSGAAKLKEIYGADIYMHELTKRKTELLKNAKKFGIEDILNHNANIPVDVYINDGAIIKIGDTEIKVMHTSGHTDNHVTFYAEDSLFTGDLLLIGQAGRSDLPGGNPYDQYDSIFNKILTLPGNTKIYPGHDYEENEFAYLKDELVKNPFLKKRTKEEYIEYVKDFFPPFTEAVGENGKMTLQCGTKRVAEPSSAFNSITPQQLFNMMDTGKELFLLDVREPFELLMGKVDGVINIPVGNLPWNLNKLPDISRPIVCICASGNRSFEAAHYLTRMGYQDVYNLEGGTYGWLQSGFEVKS